MLPKKLAFVDVETTGGSHTSDRIIEIGIVRVEDGEVVETFSSLVDPQSHLPQEIERLTGITKDDLRGAPTFGQIKQDVVRLLDACIFVAHNVRFDYSFIKHELAKEHISFCPKQLCTVKLSRHLFPSFGHHNLDSLIERFNFQCPNRHRAFDDAKVLWDFYQMLCKTIDEPMLVAAIASVTKKPSLPVGIDQATIDALPHSPGVYIFYGDDGIPLYVGKSKNIRERVVSHFAQDHADTKEMKLRQAVKSIETLTTVGELGALLRESILVKQLMPLYNRKLRRYQKLVCVTKKQTSDGFDSVTIEEMPTIQPSMLGSVLGLFKSKQQAKNHLFAVANEHALCKRLLGLESIGKQCFGHRLGTCQGACAGKELPLAYNMRFAQAFTRTRLASWPYEGVVAALETDAVGRQCEVFLLDDWRCLGSVVVSETDLHEDLVSYALQQLAEGGLQPFTLSALKLVQQAQKSRLRQASLFAEATEPQGNAVPFDIDTYKILQGFLRTSANVRRVFPIATSSLTSFLSTEDPTAPVLSFA